MGNQVDHDNKQKTSNVGSKDLWIIGGGLIFIGILCSVVLSIFCYRQNRELTKLIRENVLNEQKETKEDDIKIAGEYFIRSTLPISEAYKDGDNSKLDDKQKETLDMASAIVDKVIKKDMSDFEKEKAIFLWMRENLVNDSGILTVIPTTQNDSENPYGVLKYHNAVCVGYATTFRLFMQMLDIPCMVVHNNDNFHTWNLVQLDGHWYHTDVYSSMDSKNYSYFNMNDMMCMRSQEWDRDFFPAADGLTYNMAYREREEGCDIYKIPKKIRKALDKKTDCLSLLYGKDFTEEQAAITMQILSNLEEKIRCYDQYANCGLNYYFTQVDEGYLLVIYMSYYTDTGENGTLSEKENEKIRKTLENVFSDLEPNDYNGEMDDYEE